MQPTAPRPVRNLTAFVFGDHALHLGSELAVRRIPKGILHAQDTASIFFAFLQEQPLMWIAPGEAIRREDHNRLEFAQAGLVPQTV
jgi:hypothetical protein